MYSCESETRAAAGHNVGSPIFAHWVEGVILLAAGKSQWIGPALVKKLEAVKDDVEVAAAATMMYKENDNEHGTL